MNIQNLAKLLRTTQHNALFFTYPISTFFEISPKTVFVIVEIGNFTLSIGLVNKSELSVDDTEI